MQSTVAYYRQGNISIIYDDVLLNTAPDRLFEENMHSLKATNNIGRGTVVFFPHQDLNLVLKRYHRGGLPGRYIRNSYLYRSAESSRMWREFLLLQQMRELELPVPRPIAARCVRTSLLTCRGELITEEIGNAETLNEIIIQRPLPATTWQTVGSCLARFHRHQVYHADLNADNIMLDTNDGIFLIDFDKGEIRQRHNEGWKKQNLDRLLRSLYKHQKKNTSYHFSDTDWQALLQGYAEGAASK